MQPNIANPLADFSQKRPVETTLKPASRLFTPSQLMKLSKANLSVTPMVVAAFILLGFIAAPRAQILQHFHVTAGAASTTVGSPLYFTDADSFLAESGYVANMPLITNIFLPTIGYYMGGPTFTAGSGDGADGPPAAPGARIALVVRAVDGPPGAHWSFWETSGNEEYGNAITFTYATGTTNGTNALVLSENDGLPGQDPFGHIHGRAFTVDKPGLYTVWVQLIDTSRNGPGGGPIHTPSPLYRYYFQAGTTIARLARTNSSVVVTFGTQPSNAARQYSYFLEASFALDDSVAWTTIAGPLSGNNRLRSFTDTPPADAPYRFYRLRVTTP